VLEAVDHDGDAPAGVRAGQLPQRRAVDRGIGDDEVVVAVAGQPQRLREREGEDAAQARAERAVDQGAAPDRLRRQPYRGAGGAAQQVGRVGVERVQIDDRERRIQVRRRPVEAIPGLRFGPGGHVECRAR
jgi:hypothetical protein